MTFTCGKSSNSGLEKRMEITETLSYRAGVIMTYLSQPNSETAVKPVYNGHLVDRRKWPL